MTEPIAPPPPKSFTLIDSITLKIDEPSGLAFIPAHNQMYIVSDIPNNGLYKMDTDGSIIEKIDFRSNDLEAIAFNPIDSTIWVSEESLLQLVKLDSEGNEIDRMELDYPKSFTDLRIEGLTINSNINSLILLNEKNPGAIIEMDLINLSIKNIYILDFASDYSGICYNEVLDNYIIVSDENQNIYYWDNHNGSEIISELDYPKAEGIAIFNDHYFVVSEQENKLYKYIFK